MKYRGQSDSKFMVTQRLLQKKLLQSKESIENEAEKFALEIKLKRAKRQNKKQEGFFATIQEKFSKFISRIW